MPGEPVILVSGLGGHIRSFVDALSRFPAEPPRVVVGGFAVHVRIKDVHRVTNDLDTVSRNQPSLVEILVAEPDVDRLATADPPSDYLQRIVLENNQRGVVGAKDTLEASVQSHMIDPGHLWIDDFDGYFNACHAELLATISKVMGKPVSGGTEAPDETPADYELVHEDSLTLHSIDD